MGLDVYLYKYEDFDAVQKRQADVREKETQIYEEIAKQRGLASAYDLSDKDKENAYAMWKVWCKGQPDLDEYGDVQADVDSVEQDSKIHPNKLFRLGYFRSSYNGAGINRVLRDTLGVESDLYWIFESGFSGNDDYHVRPDWNEALDRANDVLDRFNEFVKVGGQFFTMTADFNPFQEEFPGDEKAALDIFLQEWERSKDRDPDDDFAKYSNGHGTFAPTKPYEVVGVIPGKKTGWAGKLLTGKDTEEHCVYLVCKNDHGYQSYVESLEIVIETIEHVLAQPDPEKYVLHWSG